MQYKRLWLLQHITIGDCGCPKHLFLFLAEFPKHLCLRSLVLSAQRPNPTDRRQPGTGHAVVVFGILPAASKVLPRFFPVRPSRCLATTLPPTLPSLSVLHLPLLLGRPPRRQLPPSVTMDDTEAAKNTATTGPTFASPLFFFSNPGSASFGFDSGAPPPPPPPAVEVQLCEVLLLRFFSAYFGVLAMGDTVEGWILPDDLAGIARCGS